MGDFVDLDNKFVDANILRFRTGINFNENDYWRVRPFIQQFIDNNLHKMDHEHVPIDIFLSNEKLKSKNFRPFFQNYEGDIKSMQYVKKRYLKVGLNTVQESAREIFFQSTWHLSYLSMDVRNFFFKFLHNYLKLNASINHFDNSVSQECSFCLVDNRRPAPKEVIEHVYYECPTIILFAQQYFKDYFLQNCNINFEHQWLFIGAPTYLSENFINVINIEIAFFNFFVYKSRFKKRRPIVRDLKQFMFWNRKIAMKNKRYQLNFKKLNVPFDNG